MVKSGIADQGRPYTQDLNELDALELTFRLQEEQTENLGLPLGAEDREVLR